MKAKKTAVQQLFPGCFIDDIGSIFTKSQADKRPQAHIIATAMFKTINGSEMDCFSLHSHINNLPKSPQK
jgi:hypothetical protein